MLLRVRSKPEPNIRNAERKTLESQGARRAGGQGLWYPDARRAAAYRRLP